MDFIHKVASYSPVPAGGAAVANSFCLAVALIYKVILFECERSFHATEPVTDLMNVRKEIERLLKDAERLVEKDSEAYMNFARCRRECNTVLMQKHFNDIIDVSMNVMEKAEVAFEWIGQLQRIIPAQMVTHILVASELLMGSINGSAHVLKDNLKSFKPAEKRQNYLQKLNNLHETYREKYTDILNYFPDETGTPVMDE
jgi:formiminotetrahydrofolate cyclodeaminase